MSTVSSREFVNRRAGVSCSNVTFTFDSEATMQDFRCLSFSSVLVLCASASLSCPVTAGAQVDRSALSGTVTDPSGRLLGQARVIAVENATQLRREGVSDGVGKYEIAELPVGKYTITVDHPGFETLARSPMSSRWLEERAP